MRIAMYVALVVSLILVPFVLWEGPLASFAERTLTAGGAPAAVAAAVVALLAADVLLPVPSSVVSAAAGALLGLRGGFVAVWVGMTLGCVLGFGLGRFARRFVERRLLTQADVARIRASFDRSGGWLVVTTRPVPVLAELVILTAGVAGLPFTSIVLLSAGANAVIAAVYAAAGSYAWASESLTLWVFAALGLPWAARTLHARLSRR